MAIPDVIEFEGVTYRLMGRQRYYLSQASETAKRKGAKGLHVAIWESHHGRPVPPGWVVHHADGDPLNNDPSNLVAMSAAEHRAIPRPLRDPEKQRRHLDRVRALAAQWHASPEGRRWHADNSRAAWERRRETGPQQHVCEGCGATFTAWRADARYCTAVCRNRHLRRTVPRPTVERVCAVCGATFTTIVPPHKDRVAKTCSRVCRRKLAREP